MNISYPLVGSLLGVGITLLFVQVVLGKRREKLDDYRHGLLQITGKGMQISDSENTIKYRRVSLWYKWTFRIFLAWGAISMVLIICAVLHEKGLL